MSPNGRIKNLRQSVRLLDALQTDLNRHTRAWYPICTRSRTDPRTLDSQLTAWVKGLSELADAAVAVQEMKELRKRERAS